MSAKNNFSSSGFVLILERKPDNVLYLYFFPCVIMVITSWVSFAVNFEAVPGRLGMLLTILLMLINMNNSIATSIPRSEVPCPLLLFLVLSIIFVILALIEYFVILLRVKFGCLKVQVGKKANKEQNPNLKDWATGLDKAALAIFPSVYFCSIAVFLFTTHKIE